MKEIALQVLRPLFLMGERFSFEGSDMLSNGSEQLLLGLKMAKQRYFIHACDTGNLTSRRSHDSLG